MEQLLSYHIWSIERAIYILRQTSLQTGRNIETFTVVVDAAHWSISNANSDVYTFFRAMSLIDSDHYPERLGCLIVLNIHTTVSFTYNRYGKIICIIYYTIFSL